MFSACDVSALSWGYSDTTISNGYITVNDKTINTKIYRGFNIVELDVSKCVTSRVYNFDTQGSTNDSLDLAKYINSLPTSTVLIGITAQSAIGNLEAIGKAALFSIGVNVTGLEIRGKVAFVAQVGRPGLAVMKMGPRYGDNVKIAVKVRGNSYAFSADILE
jgi:Interleukin-like EMT inducer